MSLISDAPAVSKHETLAPTIPRPLQAKRIGVGRNWGGKMAEANVKPESHAAPARGRAIQTARAQQVYEPLRPIFNEFSECSIDALAYELNRRGITAPKGRAWLPITVYRARKHLGLLPSGEKRKTQRAQRQKERGAQLRFDHAVKSAVSRIDLALKKMTLMLPEGASTQLAIERIAEGLRTINPYCKTLTF
jgi:hypothetical protein